MNGLVAILGFGEAGMAFANGMAASVVAYDRKTYVGATRRDKLDDYARLNVAGTMTNRAAVHQSPLILSVVTAGRALAAARETARSIMPDALFCDMNSVAPETKRLAATAIHHAGGRYVDVAVMAPVHPGRLRVPLLLSGPHAQAGLKALTAIGFCDVRVVPGDVGAASAIKMIRSVMVKGLEALTTECMLAAKAAGVCNEVMASLDASWPGIDWAAKANYNLERMTIHGIRRAEEMEEAVKTLDALGCDAAMSRATVERQRAIGRMNPNPNQPLDDQIGVTASRNGQRAA